MRTVPSMKFDKLIQFISNLRFFWQFAVGISSALLLTVKNCAREKITEKYIFIDGCTLQFDFYYCYSFFRMKTQKLAAKHQSKWKVFLTVFFSFHSLFRLFDLCLFSCTIDAKEGKVFTPIGFYFFLRLKP